MSCTSCLKSYSFLRPEKGCPGCGFSYCSKCLNNKIFLHKINSEAKVCGKCKNAANSQEKPKFDPPDAYFKRIGAINPQTNVNKNSIDEESKDPVEEEIRSRLEKLKEGKQEPVKSTDKDITDRLNTLKNIPTTSQAELEQRLANLKNVPVSTLHSKPILTCPDLRTEEEQAHDLMRQYMEQTSIDKKYKDEFEEKVGEIEMRLQKLKGSAGTTQNDAPKEMEESESEEETIKKIIEKAKEEALLEDDFSSPINELPFCEICNENAKMRCLGCKYLFCKRCFMEHRDEDDGCDKYETYTAPKSFQY
ncbi:abscission/NoCut checkpoint regulator [Zerene cesonia]|uniref:abscission/NoCut checkpoint regulator n=1 Tax=Zerene cesonia TaxID=33412 RepID=UPI0018E56B6C|nr:abscission/NoCut checkpoint regulator [Zerene cesonia]